MTSEPLSCEVCAANRHKYKCPKCIIKYCCLACFKSHKEQLCEERQLKQETEKEEKAQVTLSGPLVVPSPHVEHPFEETEDIIQQDILDKLGQNEKLKQMLENPHLQTILRHANSTDLPEEVMRDAMQEPIFLEFADTCLRTVDPARYAGEMDVEL